MIGCIHDNTILDRLPISLSGITHVFSQVTGGVCPKLHNWKKVIDVSRVR